MVNFYSDNLMLSFLQIRGSPPPDKEYYYNTDNCKQQHNHKYSYSCQQTRVSG